MRRLVLGFCVLLTLTCRAVIAGDGSVDPATGDVDFNVHFNFPPTSQQLADIKTSLRQLSLGVCDATDGQMRIKTIRLTQARADADRGNFWVHALPGRSGGSITNNGSDLVTLGRHLNMFSGAFLLPDVWLHEWGHHAFGLGEQYDEQRRFGGSCGIGPGFDTGSVTETNHSIMQQSGRMQCVGGTNDGNRCFQGSQCPSGSCDFVNMSEMSVSGNHDPVQGTGVCPTGAPITSIALTGNMSTSSTIQSFDDTDFGTATATSSWLQAIEAIDDIGNLPALRISVFGTRTDINEWLVTAAADAGMLSGTSGELVVLDQWTLTFNSDGSLNSLSDATPSVLLSGLTTGASDLNVSLSFGTPNPSNTAGAGRDGLITGVAVTSVVETHDGAAQCNAVDCAQRWNNTTMRFETTMQTQFNGGLSDWGTLARNYSFIVPPVTPAPTASPSCFRDVEFEESIEGSDQLLLVFDRSGSMAWSSRNDVAEVCSNGEDDDNDGTVDEASCADSRIEFVRAAGRAFVELQNNRGIDVGLLSFNDGNVLDLPIETLTNSNIMVYRDALDDLSAGGETAIGDAFDSSTSEFTRVASIGRSRTAYLLTDGFNTTGGNPVVAAERLRDIGVRIYAIPAGTDVNTSQLNDIAQKSAGQVFAAPDVAELTAIFAELSARHLAGGLSLPRTDFVLARDPRRAFELYPELKRKEVKVDTKRLFEIPVEKNAKRLTAFVAGRNERMREWGVAMELVAPDGTAFGPGSPELTVDSHFIYIDVIAPQAGIWELVVIPEAPAVQFATALAFVENPRPHLIADVRPRVLSAGSTAMATVDIAYYVDIDREDVELAALLRGPDGLSNPVMFNVDMGGVFRAEIDGLSTNGMYELIVKGEVDNGARVIEGEPIFDGPARAPIVVEPFSRFTTVSFKVVNGKDPECESEDCDSDGVVDEAECKGQGFDVDKDGIPNFRDTDSDNDQIPDAVEAGQDRDINGVDDACEPGPKRDVPIPLKNDIGTLIERQKRVLGRICAGRLTLSVQVDVRGFAGSLVNIITQARPSRDKEEKIQTILPGVLALLQELTKLVDSGQAECRIAEQILVEVIEDESRIQAILE